MGVAYKLLSEKIASEMHERALSIQRSRVVDCVAVGKECESYLLLINQIIQFASDGVVTSEEEQTLRKSAKEMHENLNQSLITLESEWRIYKEKGG